jgi:hypothetical protein
MLSLRCHSFQKQYRISSCPTRVCNDIPCRATGKLPDIVIEIAKFKPVADLGRGHSFTED